MQDRPQTTWRNGTSMRARETEAVAYVVRQAIGLETSSAAKDYIQLYDEDPKLLSESLQYIQQTASGVISAVGVMGAGPLTNATWLE